MRCPFYEFYISPVSTWRGDAAELCVCGGGQCFFRQPSHGKRHLCTSVSPPFTHGQSPSVQPCCMCSLSGMHESGFDFGPCPSCSKQREWAAPALFFPQVPPKVANPRGPPCCICFHTSIVSLDETSSELGAAGYRPCGSVPSATHCWLWERPQMPLHSHGNTVAE